MKSRTFFLVSVIAIAVLSYEVGRRRGASETTASTNERIVLPTGTPPSKQPSLSSDSRQREVVKTLHDENGPYAQNLSAAQRGYAAAEVSIDEALKQIDSLPFPERMGFITGIFSFVASHYSPADALVIYQQVPELHRPNALRALVAEWIHTRSPLDADTRYAKRENALALSGSRLGLEAELTSLLASSNLDAELTMAWLDAFSSHGSRSEILSILAGRVAYLDPGSFLNRIETWTDWEKDRVTRTFLSQWSSGAPQEAWNWFQSHRNQIPEDYTSNMLQSWASVDPDGVKGLLGTLADPSQRQIAISAIGKVLAEKNTDEAVAWAESIANEEERAVAQRAVYDGAPRGIGAVLDFEKGFPRLRGIVPGSPLDGTGAKPGDQIVELRDASGASHSLYGRDLQTAVNLIRGEPGTQLTLRVLRANGDNGQMEEHLIAVTRGQLYLDEKLIPKPPQG